MKKNIFIAAAWPYANGSLHLGHLAGLLGSDILARYFRLAGNPVLFVSGTDCHGTPIVIEAGKQSLSALEIAKKYHQEFSKTLIKDLSFSFDLYTSTMTDNHRQVVQDIFLRLYEAGLIYKKTEELPYCHNCQRFLPDRYVEGTCPRCNFSSARGDQCDSCGNLMNVRELIDLRCKICSSQPSWRESEHFFLKISEFNDVLKNWVEKSQGWKANAKNFSQKLLEQGFHDRAISRDTDWGISVPLDGYENKKIYVWFEAVCGYLSASIEWAEKNGSEKSWEDFWKNDSALHYYVHGKDNIPFHTIIWPSILLGLKDLHLPDRIISSEYLTLEKKQFSKSRSWALWLPDFLEKFDSEALRYYLTINGPENSDADFSWREFAIKTNNELIGTLANFVHRSLSFIAKNFPEGLDFPEDLDEKSIAFLNLTKDSFSKSAQALERGSFKESLKIALSLSEAGNRYFNELAPWKLIKDNKEDAGKYLAVVAQVIKSLAILISPFLPKTSEKIAKNFSLKTSDLSWSYPETSFVKISEPEILFEKISEEDLMAEEERLGIYN